MDEKKILIAIIVFVVIFLGFVAYKIYTIDVSQAIANVPTGLAVASAMTMTAFDKELAKELMDKDADGQCDSCDMSIDTCIDTGQLQCNMDSKSTIGVLGSQHIHANWKIYINGKALGEEFFGLMAEAHEQAMKDSTVKATSSFIHVHESKNLQEKVGYVLHMHATGVPLWMFFKSVGVELPDGMKAYVNGKPISDWQNYVFSDSDKILITDGVGNLDEQLNSITSFESTARIEDKCATPLGYTEQQWREHMGHHPELYRECLKNK